MKTITLSLLLFLSLFSTAQTIYPSGVGGCIARWTFDGALPNIPDMSGNNNHGNNNSIISAPGWKNAANMSGKFNGVNSYSRVVNHPTLVSNQITAIALVKFDGFFSGSCQGNNIIYYGFDYAAQLNWAMYVCDGNYDNNCGTYSPNFEKLNFVTPGYNNMSVPLNNYIDTSKWYLLATTFNGNTVNYYQIIMDSNNKVNNVTPAYTATCNFPIGTGAYDIFMGATQNPPFPYWFNGKMDEVILFNKALTNLEMQSVYNYLFGYPAAVGNIEKENQMNIVCLNKHLTINNSNNIVKDIIIYDINGRIMRQINDLKTNDIDLSQFPTQLIFVKATTIDNKTISQKILLAE